MGVSGPRAVLDWLRPALPFWALYVVLIIAADQFQDVDLIPMVLLLLAGAAIAGAARRLGR